MKITHKHALRTFEEMSGEPFPLVELETDRAREYYLMLLRHGAGYEESMRRKLAALDVAERTQREANWWDEGAALGLFPLVTLSVEDIKERLRDGDEEPPPDEQIIEAIGEVMERDWSDYSAEAAGFVLDRLPERR